jgi:hypothetical protein
MRLLDTQTYQLINFLDKLPPYAILSHTWQDDEVTFSDIGNEIARSRLKGWSKISNCCLRAQKDGYSWVWIDTCCIDKSNPTELGEAINSMCRWYQDAQICYAYLEDVPPRYWLRDGGLEGVDGNNGIPWEWYFRSSRWFTRGWTLQELLAPIFVMFLDRGWAEIGSREEYADEIYKSTAVEAKFLWDFRSSSVATRLSWAANHQTTREEDMAYSLLGLLEVNMPLIYGEGKRAFIRLQRELIENHNDETILAWGSKFGKLMH